MSHRGTPEALAITAAVATAVPGYVYVEAYKEAHVRTAIEQIRNVFPSSLRLVPMVEVPGVLRVASSREHTHARIAVGSWVRMKGAADYRGDLASVFSIDGLQARGEVVVQLLPRMDYTVLTRFPDRATAVRRCCSR
jgi:transcription elongation factor SPT5